MKFLYHLESELKYQTVRFVYFIFIFTKQPPLDNFLTYFFIRIELLFLYFKYWMYANKQKQKCGELVNLFVNLIINAFWKFSYYLKYNCRSLPILFTIKRTHEKQLLFSFSLALYNNVHIGIINLKCLFNSL